MASRPRYHAALARPALARGPMPPALLLLLLVAAPAATPPRAVGAPAPAPAAVEPTPHARARSHYAAGDRLFDARQYEQALIEFKQSLELTPLPATLFMMAQCEYLLGELKAARAHYEAYVAQSPGGEFAELARDRIDSINRRPATVIIYAVPDAAEVSIVGDGPPIAGQAPGEFRVPRGRYQVTVSKANHRSERRELEVDIADSRSLFFKLEPVPARLEVRTRPRHATLYVRGTRAQNPYVQSVEPGQYELYAEATDYVPRRDVIDVAAGESRTVDLRLQYVQRSGRPELIWFWAGAGAAAGGTGVLARFGTPGNPATATTIAGGAIVGAIAGGVVATRFVPEYIPDNRALFRIGAAWLGATEGAMLGLGASGNATMTWIGGAAGLATGAVVGTLKDERAPTYGRVALIQSAAAVGVLGGALLVPALDLDNSKDRRAYAWSILGGLNLGLGAGLTLAYLPDQRLYGPSWQRVVLIDLAGVAGLLAGSLLSQYSCISDLGSGTSAGDKCRFESRPTIARAALAGTAIGLGVGWFLTRRYDPPNQPASPSIVALLPVPGALPVETPEGRMRVIPGLMTAGRF